MVSEEAINQLKWVYQLDWYDKWTFVNKFELWHFEPLDAHQRQSLFGPGMQGFHLRPGLGRTFRPVVYYISRPIFSRNKFVDLLLSFLSFLDSDIPGIYGLKEQKTITCNSFKLTSRKEVKEVRLPRSFSF